MTKREAEAMRARCAGSLIRLNRDDCLNALDMLERAMLLINEMEDLILCEPDNPLTRGDKNRLIGWSKKLLREWEAKDSNGEPPQKTS